VTSFIVWQVLSFYDLKISPRRNFGGVGEPKCWVKIKCDWTALPSEVLPISL
jgi:hypothetical protein